MSDPVGRLVEQLVEQIITEGAEWRGIQHPALGVCGVCPEIVHPKCSRHDWVQTIAPCKGNGECTC